MSQKKIQPSQLNKVLIDNNNEISNSNTNLNNYHSPTHKDLSNKILDESQQDQINLFKSPAPKSDMLKFDTESGGAYDSEKKNLQLLSMQRSSLMSNDSNIQFDVDSEEVKPNYDKLVEKLKETHPYKDNGEPYNCKDVCWDVDTGCNILWKTTDSDLQKFGVGIVLYFKYLKTLIAFFFIFMLLSIPHYVFNIKAYDSDLDSGGSTTESYFLASTIGSLGLGDTACSQAQIPYWNSTSSANVVTLSCKTGPITSTSKMIYGYTTSSQSCSSLVADQINLECNSQTATAPTTQLTTCAGQYSCTFSVDNSYFDLTTTSCQSKMSSYYAVFYVNCQNENLNFNNKSLSKYTISFLMTSTDAAITLLFFIMIIFLRYSREKTVKNIIRNSHSVSSFTVEVENLPKHIPHDQLGNKLWSYIEERINEDNQGGPKHEIVDLQIVLPSKLEDLRIEHYTTIEKRSSLIKQWIINYAPEYHGTTISFKHLTMLMKAYEADISHKNIKSARKSYKKIEKLKQTKTRIENDMLKIMNNPDLRVVAVYVTFNTMEAHDKALEIFGMTYIKKFSRLIFGCCYDKKSKRYFEGKIISVSGTDDPSNIIWANLELTTSQRLFRYTVSFVVTLLLWLITCCMVLIATNAKTDYKTKYPNPNCSGLDPTQADVITDYAKGVRGYGLLQCYCLKDLTGRLYTDFSGYGTLCWTWVQEKTLQTTISLSVVFMVVIINYIIQVLFRQLSKFERHKTISEELSSRLVKIFLAQFLNTGLIILILNAKFRSTSDGFFFKGIYNDISTLWFSNVGTTLLSTMFINTFSVPGAQLIEQLVTSIKQCFDRSCSCDKRKTRRKTQQAYEELYSGREFLIDFRYAQILNMIYVCFLYSSGMPLLYIMAFIQLFLSYFVDKFFLLKRCKKPDNFDEKMDYRVRNTMFPAVIIHLIFAIWIYGNYEFFQTSTDSTLSSYFSGITNVSSKGDDSYSSRAKTRFFNETHNFVLTAMLILFGSILIIKAYLFNYIKGIFTFCCGKTKGFVSQRSRVFPKDKLDKIEKEDYEGIADKVTYLDLLDSSKLKTLIAINKLNLKKSSNLNKELYYKKIEKMEKALKDKEQVEKLSGEDSPSNFLGLYTYEISENPKYKKLFEMDSSLENIEVVEVGQSKQIEKNESKQTKRK